MIYHNHHIIIAIIIIKVGFSTFLKMLIGI